MNPLGGSIPFLHLPGQFCTLTVAPRRQADEAQLHPGLLSDPARLHRDHSQARWAGLGLDYLHNAAKPGDLLEIAAPFGSFIFTGREAPSVVLISGGVGITPLMSVTRYLTDRSWAGDMFLLYGCRSPNDIIYREELELPSAPPPQPSPGGHGNEDGRYRLERFRRPDHERIHHSAGAGNRRAPRPHLRAAGHDGGDQADTGRSGRAEESH